MILRNLFSGSSLKRLLGYLPPYKGIIALSIFFMVSAGAASSLIAWLLGKLTDVGFYNQAAWIIVAAPLGLIGVSFLHGGSMFMSNYLLGKVSQSVSATLRQQMFHRLLRWPSAAYQNNSTGAITSKFVFEANVMLSNATKSCIILVRDSSQVVGLVATLLWQDWKLSLVALIIGPLIFLLLRYVSRKMKSVMASCQESFAGILSRVKEVYEAHRLIKISNTYKAEYDRFAHINNEIYKMMVRMTKVTTLGTPASQVLCMIGIAVVLTFAVFQMQNGALDRGQFVTFLAALLLLIPPVKNLAGMNTGFIMIKMAADSIFATLDEKEEEDNGKTELDYCSGQVVFDHVSLRYPNSERDAVHDFNLTVNPGDSVALVGFSGSGKTSLVNMIPRFWNPTSGRILIDGYDTRDITLKSLRKQIAIVSQDVILFDDTIRNNIAYGVPDATEAQINKAIDDAALREFIDALPKGLETPVGEAGNFLSGGQKQRISIARAILKDTPILILDEATSALDSISETHIKNALAKLMKGRTVFIVAHRLSTVSGATTIVAMAEGEVKEIGTRDELLKKGGLFANLCHLQSLHVLETE